MKRGALLLIALISSCVLPEFTVNPALDQAATAGSGASMSQAGSQSASSGSSSGGSDSPGLGGKPDGGAPYVDPGMPAAGDGTCSDENYPTLCGTTCRNLTFDSSACGDCAIHCPAQAQCLGSECVCPDEKLACDGQCKEQNEARCGGCLTHCKGAESCTDAHQCVLCPTGCVNLKTDSLDAAALDSVLYMIDLGAPTNLRNAVVSIKLYSGLNQYGVLKLVMDNAVKGTGDDFQLLPNVNGSIQTVDVVVRDEARMEDITEIGFRVSALGGAVPASQIFIDSITISGNLAGPWDFATATSVNTLTYRAALSDVNGSVEWVKN